jgi:undecaprenyl-diphosphatase
MTWIDVLLLGAVEGLTEFLPVSSTGHLILLGERLGQNGEAAKTLEIVIQLGAILAVVIYYRARLLKLVTGVFRRDPADLRLLLALAIAFTPAAIIGLLLHKAIKRVLFHTEPVAVALIAGGILMIAVEFFLRRRAPKPSDEAPPAEGEDTLAHVTPKRALVIGFAQCFSLWPGASRAMTTIVGGQLTGLSTATAAEFSFLLAIPTLGAATLFDLAKNGRTLLDAPSGMGTLVLGLSVAFAVALLVITSFLKYLKRFGLTPFGVYRVLLGAVVLSLAMSGALRDPGESTEAASAAAPTSAK